MTDTTEKAAATAAGAVAQAAPEPAPPPRTARLWRGLTPGSS